MVLYVLGSLCEAPWWIVDCGVVGKYDYVCVSHRNTFYVYGEEERA